MQGASPRQQANTSDFLHATTALITLESGGTWQYGNPGVGLGGYSEPGIIIRNVDF